VQLKGREKEEKGGRRRNESRKKKGREKRETYLLRSTISSFITLLHLMLIKILGQAFDP
jgi:hypothetical protein